MIDFEYYRARRWHKRRSLPLAIAWVGLYFTLFSGIAYLFATRF